MSQNDFHKQKTQPDLTSDTPPGPLPKKIGPYKIESLLSKGGMSFLYLGSNLGSTQPIAIKVLSPKYFANKEMENRFLKEAQIIAMADHPNIVKLYGQGSWEKGLYIAMEFIQGVSLRQFIQQKSLSHKRAIEIVLQVAFALCHLHTHGVIHRDLKPENILITETGQIKVIDFGIAQMIGEEEDPPISKKQRIIGTPIYMSPEQKENYWDVSCASDIYSLGVIAYELVLGRLSHGIIHLSLLPQTLRPMIGKALEPHPKERYQDIVDFITDISHYLKSLSGEKEKTDELMSEQMLEMVQHARQISISDIPSTWSQIDLGIAIQKGILLSGLYLDFFKLSKNRFCIILAEPEEGGMIALFHTAGLRGMIRMAFQQGFLNGKEDIRPIKVLTHINQALAKDSTHQKFSFSLVILNPEKNQLSFVSSNFKSLWHIAEGSKKVKVLSTPNPPLGTAAEVVLLETTDNWNAGDTLILQSSNKNEEAWNDLINEDAFLSAQAQADKQLKKICGKEALQPRTAAVISIHRIY
jgi:hypothetical protein